MLTQHLGALVGLCLLAAPIVAAPPATEVRANVHAASTLALGLMAQTPTSGDASAENAIFQNVAAGGLGEVMGWGQDYWDQVDPATTQTVTTAFQAAFRLLQSLFDSDSVLSFAALAQANKQLTVHFSAMQKAVAAPASDGAQRKREAATMAKLLSHHVSDLPGSPMNPTPKVGILLALRTVKSGVASLETGLAGHPDLLAKVKPSLDALRAVQPPATETAAALKKLVESTLPHLKQVEQVLK